MSAAIMETRAPKVPFRVKLFAWWRGYDPADVYPGDPVELEFDTRRRSPDAQVAGVAKTRKTQVPLWTADRIQVVERLWGPGLHTPGGEEHVKTLVKPFGLNPTMTVLDLGAGLQGCRLGATC